jgi:thymidine phosphorylase
VSTRTTSTSKVSTPVVDDSFPAGSGTGTIREVTAWQQITQILETNTQGGDQQFVTYSFLEDDAEHQIPTVKSPIVFKLQDRRRRLAAALRGAGRGRRRPCCNGWSV